MICGHQQTGMDKQWIIHQSMYLYPMKAMEMLLAKTNGIHLGQVQPKVQVVMV